MPYLVFDSGTGERIQIVLTARGIRIGRDPSCDLVIPNEAASRHHATVTLEGSRAVFRDERSHNGSLVNGSRVAEARLSDRDRIHIGGFDITYLERDPYGEDSVQIPVPGAAAPETWNGAALSPDPSPQVASKPRLPGLAIVAVLVFMTMGVMVLGGFLVWPLFFGARRLGPPQAPAAPATAPADVLDATPPASAPGPAGSTGMPPAAPALPPGAWADPGGLLTLTPPSGFQEAERSDAGIRFVGPSGGKFQSSITVSIQAARPGATSGSEISLAERSLMAELGARYQRIGGGELQVGGRSTIFLIYQRPSPEGIILQHWLILRVENGQRASLSLSAELGMWETVKPAFTTFLARARFAPIPTPPPLAPPGGP